MNWDAIGAIGEIVGAAAVVATLVYLSRQVQLNATPRLELSWERSKAAGHMGFSKAFAAFVDEELAKHDAEP